MKMQKLCIIFVFILSISSIFCHDKDFCALMDTEGTVIVEGEYILDFEYLGNCNSSFDKMIGKEGNLIKIITRTSNFYQMFYDVENKTFINLNFVIIPTYTTKPLIDSLFYTANNSVFENITITVENYLYIEAAVKNYGFVFERIYNSTLKNITLKFNTIEMKMKEENQKIGLFGNSIINGSIENVRIIGNEITIRNSFKTPPQIGLMFYETNSNISYSSVDIKNISVISPEMIEVGLLIYNIREDSENIVISNCYTLVRKSLNIVNQYKVNYFSAFIYKNDNKNLTITKCWSNIKLNSLTTKHNYYLNGIIGNEVEDYNYNKKKKINILNTQITFTIQRECNQFYISIINNELKSDLYMNNSFIFINKINDSVIMSNQISDIYKNKENNEIKIENTYYSLYGDSLWIKFDDRIKYENIISIKRKTYGYALSKDKSILYYEENPYFDGYKLRIKGDDKIKKIDVVKKNEPVKNVDPPANPYLSMVFVALFILFLVLLCLLCRTIYKLKEDKKDKKKK